MKAKSTKNIKKRLGIWALVVASILAIPLLTRSPWTLGDFVFAGVVLFGSATVYEFTTRNMTNKIHRIAVGVTIFIVIIAIWGLAVSGA